MKTLLFAAVAMTAQSAGTAVAEEGGGDTMNRRRSASRSQPEHADARR